MKNQKPQYYDGSAYKIIHTQSKSITVIKPDLTNTTKKWNPSEKPLYYDGSQTIGQ